MRAAAAVAAAAMALPAAADEEFIYRLGGGEPVYIGATNRTTPVRLVVGGEWDANLMCGDFDVATSIANQLNGVSGALQTVLSNVVETATGTVASLPALALQRLNPGLYDLMQNGILEAGREFRVARLRCEALTEDMGEVLGHEGWAGIARADYWRRQMVVGGRDALRVADEAERAAPDDGVVWIEGARGGGAGQPAVALVGDVAKAGYNMLLGRRPADGAALDDAACAGARICEVWAAPWEAADWLRRVVGEVEIRTCAGCEKVAATGGQGLSAMYSRHRAQHYAELAAMVEAEVELPDADALEDMSARVGMRVSWEVVEAIKAEPEPLVVVGRLAGELAVAQTLGEAALARRALAAGMREPNVANNEVALRGVRRAIDELDGEIRQMESEVNIRRAMAGSTSAAVLQRRDLRTRAAASLEPAEGGRLREGTVER